MPELKTRESDASVAAFLDSIENEGRREDCRALHALMDHVTGCRAKMWGSGIVGFGRYRYKYASGHAGAWFLTGFSPRKQALTIYIMPGFSAYGDLMDRLGKHKTGRSCLYINRLSDIDHAALEALVDGSVQFMRSKYDV